MKIYAKNSYKSLLFICSINAKTQLWKSLMLQNDFWETQQMTWLPELDFKQGQEKSGQHAKTSDDHVEIVSHTRHHCKHKHWRQLQGVGMSYFQQWSIGSGAERRNMVKAEVRRNEEDQRKTRATAIGKQGPSWRGIYQSKG